MGDSWRWASAHKYLWVWCAHTSNNKYTSGKYRYKGSAMQMQTGGMF